MTSSTNLHMLLVKRFLRYTSGTLQFRLALYKPKLLYLPDFCDVDYASYLDDK